ncbi:NAD kinase 2, mitochondrial-like [Oscarella lobularis]|uniref:NAD kinase 2, mitochondrial-like n=1 Tax=Oscarella lobularis TaxID=121494 RepID=UPI003313A95D
MRKGFTSRRLLCGMIADARNVLVVHKSTRYEYDRSQYSATLSEIEFENALRSRGSNYAEIRRRHEAHRQTLGEIIDFFDCRRLNTRIRQQHNYRGDDVRWADVVVSAGGDGTMLLTAAKIPNKRKPLIGINTDPQRSQGQLCMVRKEGVNVQDDLTAVFEDRFRWKLRQRIRVDVTDIGASIGRNKQPFVLALNEVFLGESDPSQTSYLEVVINGGDRRKQKSSGMVVCTGSGSTAWAYNIGRVTDSQVQKVLEAAGVQNLSSQFVQEVCEKHNRSLVYDPSEMRMAFAVRDCIAKGIFGLKEPYGIAERIQVRSRCKDARLVVDAGWSCPFNDGASATLEMNEKDALLTVELI